MSMKTPIDLSPVVELEFESAKIHQRSLNKLQDHHETEKDLLEEVRSYIGKKHNDYLNIKWKIAGALNSINIYC